MVSEKKRKKRIQAITRGGVIFTFTATCVRKLCTGYTAISRTVVGKNVHATTQTGSMGYDQYTIPHSVAIEPTVLVFFFSTRKRTSMASRAILSNFFEEQ